MTDQTKIATGLLALAIKADAIPYEGPGCARIVALDDYKALATHNLGRLSAEEREALHSALEMVIRDVRVSLWADASEKAKTAQSDVEDEWHERCKDYEYACGIASGMAYEMTPAQALGQSAEFDAEGWDTKENDDDGDDDPDAEE